MSLPLLTGHFFVLSFLAFGAATSVVPDLHRLLVEQEHLMTASQFAGLFALSQAAPGTNVTFVPVLAWKVGGFAGALGATVAFCSPTACLAVALERMGSSTRASYWLSLVRRAVAPIAVGLVLATGCLIAQSSLSAGGVALVVLATATQTWTKLTPLWLTALGALLGAGGFV